MKVPNDEDKVGSEFHVRKSPSSAASMTKTKSKLWIRGIVEQLLISTIIF